MKSKFAIAIVAVVILVVLWVTLGFEGNEVPYVTINELKEIAQTSKQERFRLGGRVQEGSIVRDENNQLSISFILEQDGATLPVSYHKIVPDMFKEGIDVIVEGKYVNGRLEADNLMTKCASRYEGDLRESS